jgi:hypothetical protein
MGYYQKSCKRRNAKAKRKAKRAGQKSRSKRLGASQARKKPRNRRPRKTSSGVHFVTVYVNRWGQRMRAEDYGYVAWPIGKSR